MPNQDRTGPHGEGPKTGGGFGKCSGTKPERTDSNDRDQEKPRGVGRGGKPRGGGRGRCYGGGRGGFGRRRRGRRSAADNSPEYEDLDSGVADLAQDNQRLRARLAELESDRESTD